MDLVEQIKKEVDEYMNSLSKIRAQRLKDCMYVKPRGCPNRSRLIDELLELDKLTLHIAYHISLIGSGIQEGSIVPDSRDLNKPDIRTYVYHYPDKTITYKHDGKESTKIITKKL